MATKKQTPKTKPAKKKAAKKQSAKKQAAKKPAKKQAATKQAAKKQPAKKASSSSKPLYQRLGIREQDFHIVDPPVGFEIEVPAGFGLGFSLPSRLGGSDAVLVFVTNQAAVKALARALKKALPSSSSSSETLLWVAYPKGSGALKSDVNRDNGWGPLTALGYQGVAAVSVDSDWSALRLRHESRTSRRA